MLDGLTKWRGIRWVRDVLKAAKERNVWEDKIIIVKKQDNWLMNIVKGMQISAFLQFV